MLSLSNKLFDFFFINSNYFWKIFRMYFCVGLICFNDASLLGQDIRKKKQYYKSCFCNQPSENLYKLVFLYLKKMLLKILKPKNLNFRYLVLVNQNFTFLLQGEQGKSVERCRRNDSLENASPCRKK